MARCSIEGCGLQTYGDSDKCILHCEKDESFGEKDKNCESFDSFINALSQYGHHNKGSFRGICFLQTPKNIEKIEISDAFVDYQNRLGDLLKDIDSSVYKPIPEGFITFNNCRFYDIPLGWFSDISGCRFHKCEFQENHSFNYIVTNTNEIVPNVYYSDCKFHKYICFIYGNFKNDARFTNCIFYQGAAFIKNIFDNNVLFANCVFYREVNIKDAYFAKQPNFQNAKFNGGLVLDNVIFEKTPNFLGVQFGTDKKTRQRAFKSTPRETFRIIKDSFDKVGNHIEANKFYALEMKKRKQELFEDCPLWNAKGSLSEKIAFWFNFIISNFGQNWILPLIWLIVSAWGLMYIRDIDFVSAIMPLIKIIGLKGSDDKLKLDLTYLLFSVFQFICIWHIAVAFRRHNRR